MQNMPLIQSGETTWTPVNLECKERIRTNTNKENGRKSMEEQKEGRRKILGHFKARFETIT